MIAFAKRRVVERELSEILRNGNRLRPTRLEPEDKS